MGARRLNSDRNAGFSTRREDGRTILDPRGDWTVETIGAFDGAVHEVEETVDPGDIVIDLTGLERIDTAGAYLLGRALRRCDDPDSDRHFLGEHRTARRLVREVRERTKPTPPPESGRAGVIDVLARIGEGMENFWDEVVDTFAFFGRMVTTAAASAIRPLRLRWTATVYLMETVGVNALPIIAVLAFFIGAVVAYIGANLLETFGASVFTVELVGIAVLREFGVVITAIMLAGRSDSAFTAAIGSMKMQQEIDAMKVIGLDPYEVLVLPRVIACIVMAPLLTFAAMLSGIFGGMMVSWSALDISPSFFILRMQDTLDWTHFMVGLSKAPVFGLVVAIIGCRQGMKVGGDVESLGSRVTASVVQSIFAVIVIDALFAMMYLELDI
ncbi:ABC transporter permease [Marinicauda salina]|uniref:ABC transporter permease n=1 Tax=Marinicauda salina TaxID=2135793 RepID=A0A2U2BSU3_9PROT|nr:ABC transporter permease [Marinicauda salina]PWE17068.1 ABC transporter permease [Marinicauda salina]